MSEAVADDTKVGLFRDLTYIEYEQINAVRHSVLRHFGRSALHAREAIVNPPKQTEAMAIGQAIHCAILEPERFDVTYMAAPKLDRRTKKGQATWAELQASPLNIITAEEYDLCLRVRESVWSHSFAAELLRGKGLNEVSAVWVDQDTGARCKARFDRLSATQLTDPAGTAYSAIIDLKTTHNASRRAFSDSAGKLAYHEAAAFYLDGAFALSPRPRKFIWIAMEKEPPYAVAVYEVGDASIEAGRDAYKAHLRAYAEAVRTGVWAGYGEGADYLDIPAWMLRWHQEQVA